MVGLWWACGAHRLPLDYHKTSKNRRSMSKIVGLETLQPSLHFPSCGRGNFLCVQCFTNDSLKSCMQKRLGCILVQCYNEYQ